MTFLEGLVLGGCFSPLECIALYCVAVGSHVQGSCFMLNILGYKLGLGRSDGLKRT
jgi:hypothetical protein